MSQYGVLCATCVDRPVLSCNLPRCMQLQKRISFWAEGRPFVRRDECLLRWATEVLPGCLADVLWERFNHVRLDMC